jgi:hypothetical protein
MTTIQELEAIYGPVIDRYARQQAIDDGLLVDLCADYMDEWIPAMVREAGIKIPVAMTATVFHDCVSPIEDENGNPDRGETLAPCQDIKGRLWDVLCMFAHAARNTDRNSSEILYRLRVVPNIPTGSKRHPRAKLVTLKAVIGGDDNGEPCITIMHPHED